MFDRLFLGVLVFLCAVIIGTCVVEWLVVKKDLDEAEFRHRQDMQMAELCEAQKSAWDASNPQVEKTQHKLCDQVQKSLEQYDWQHSHP